MTLIPPPIPEDGSMQQVVQFHNPAGDPVEQLVIRVQKDDAGAFIDLMMNMQTAAVSHDQKYGVGVEKNTILVLEALSTMVELAFDVKEEDRPIDMLGDIVAFHEKFDLAYHGKPRCLIGVKDDVGADLGEFRTKFDREETDEYEDDGEALKVSVDAGDTENIVTYLHKQLDALVDGMYVKLGTAYLQFGPAVFREAWRRVHSANMKKKRAERVEESKRGSLFDVVKPEGWVEPDHRDLVRDNAHVIYRKPGTLNAGYEHDTQAVQPGTEFIGTNQ